VRWHRFHPLYPHCNCNNLLDPYILELIDVFGYGGPFTEQEYAHWYYGEYVSGCCCVCAGLTYSEQDDFILLIVVSLTIRVRRIQRH